MVIAGRRARAKLLVVPHTTTVQVVADRVEMVSREMHVVQLSL